MLRALGVIKRFWKYRQRQQFFVDKHNLDMIQTDFLVDYLYKMGYLESPEGFFWRKFKRKYDFSIPLIIPNNINEQKDARAHLERIRYSINGAIDRNWFEYVGTMKNEIRLTQKGVELVDGLEKYLKRINVLFGKSEYGRLLALAVGIFGTSMTGTLLANWGTIWDNWIVLIVKIISNV